MTFTQFKNLHEIYPDEQWFIGGKTVPRKHHILYRSSFYDLKEGQVSPGNGAILLFGPDRLIVHVSQVKSAL